MKLRYTLLALLLVTATTLSAFDAFVAVGPQFGYSGMNDDRDTELHGYVGGVTVIGEADYCDFFSSLEFQGMWNAGHYINSDCDASSIAEYLVDWKIGRWFSFDCMPCFWLKPYVGFGYDYFKDVQNPNTTNLKYTYTKLFVPLGFDLWWRASSCCSVGFQFEWRQDVYSKLHLLGANFSANTEYGYRLQLPIVCDFELCCREFTLSLIPFFDWNRYGRAVDEDVMPDPLVFDALRRWYGGLKVLVGYHF